MDLSLGVHQVWSTRGVEGVHRFLARAYRALEGGVSEQEPTRDQLRLLHATIAKVGTRGCVGV
jgi:leucyl-tRNA synthetase